MANRLYLDNLKVTMTASHVGVPGDLESLRLNVAGLRTFDVVQAAAKLLFYLERVTGEGLLAAQADLVDIFPDAMKVDLRRRLADGPRSNGFDVIFYPQQLLALQRLALALGEPGPPTSFEGGTKWPAFLAAAAQCSDAIQRTSRFPDLSTASILGGGQAKPLAIHFLRNAEANRLTFYKAVAGRAYRLWLDSRLPWPDTLEPATSFSERVFGLALEKVVAIALAPAFARVDVGKDAAPGDAPFDPELYFRQTGVPVEAALRVLDRLTFRGDSAANATSEGTFWDFVPLAERPFVQAADRLLIPCAVGKAFERATTGVFWLMHEEMRIGGSATPLTQHFGAMFEDYCLRLLESVAADHRVVAGEIGYESDQGALKSCDVLVSEIGSRSGRVFIEVGAIRPARPMFATADEVAFDNYRARIGGSAQTVGKFVQLDRVINDHLGSRFNIPDDLLARDEIYVPVVVVDEPFSWSPQLRDLLQEDVIRQELFRHPLVTRPIVMDVGELEHLVYLVEQGHSMVDLLIGYLRDTDRAIGIEHYLHALARLDAPSIVSDAFMALGDLLTGTLEFRKEENPIPNP